MRDLIKSASSEISAYAYNYKEKVDEAIKKEIEGFIDKLKDLVGEYSNSKYNYFKDYVKYLDHLEYHIKLVDSLYHITSSLG